MISIDPRSTRDIDDCFEFAVVDGIVKIRYAVPNILSQLSDEEFERASVKQQTRYRPMRVDYMLPYKVGAGTGSLQEGQERNAIIFEIDLDSDLNVIRFHSELGTITNRKAYTYDEAELVIDEGGDDQAMLSAAYLFGQGMLSKRRANGELIIYDTLQMIETTLEGAVRDMSTTAHKSYMITREMAILVCRQAAKHAAKNDWPVLYRNHTVRSHAPDRDVMIGQLNATILNPELARSLFGRMELWVNRAEYGTKLLGHYGANAPAYLTITSPGRRFPDLVNTGVWEAMLLGKDSPFTMEQLTEWADAYNSIKDKRSEYYKKAELARAESRMVNLGALHGREFYRSARIMWEQGVHFTSLKFALINKEIVHKLMARLFFTDSGYTEDEERILRTVAAKQMNGGDSLQVLNVAVQIGVLDYFSFDESGYIKSSLGNAQVKVKTSNSKATQQQAGLHYVAALASGKLIEHEPSKTLVIPPPKNYVGMLMEWGQANGQKISFSFEEREEDGLFVATVSIGEIRTQGAGHNKSSAKRSAAERVLKRLPKKREEKVRINLTNPTGTVNELVQKGKLTANYEFGRKDDMHICTIIINGKHRVAGEPQKRKSMAKSSAAQRFLEIASKQIS